MLWGGGVTMGIRVKRVVEWWCDYGKYEIKRVNGCCWRDNGNTSKTC